MVSFIAFTISLQEKRCAVNLASHLASCNLKYTSLSNCNLCYYESRGLVIFLTFVQVVVMAIIILILKVAGAKRKR